ncbi:MAG: hypothetical protein AABW49_02560 [Nanoarchaeota archaeon]
MPNKSDKKKGRSKIIVEKRIFSDYKALTIILTAVGLLIIGGIVAISKDSGVTSSIVTELDDVYFCVDRDPINDPGLSGNLDVTDDKKEVIISYQDECDDDILIQHSCSEERVKGVNKLLGLVVFEKTKCDRGCVNGACS